MDKYQKIDLDEDTLKQLGIDCTMPETVKTAKKILHESLHPHDKEVALNNLKFLQDRHKAHAGLLEAAKLAYRKHHLGDDSIGWDELEDILHDALCNELGDDGFLMWMMSLGYGV